MSISTTSVGISWRGRLKTGSSVCGWRALRSKVARRSMRLWLRRLALGWWRRRRTGNTGSGTCSATCFACSNSAVLMDRKSAL